MATPPKRALRAPPPPGIATTDPEFNRWLHDLGRLLNGVVPPPPPQPGHPDSALGVDGDWYADTAAKHIYVRVNGAWTLIV